MTDTGFMGLGNMGAPMATHIVESNHELTVYDIDSDAVNRLTAVGATAAEAGSDAVAGADVVFLSLPRSPSLKQRSTRPLPRSTTGQFWST